MKLIEKIKQAISNWFCPYAFRADNAYDIKYENDLLTFKTQDSKGEHLWQFYGSCTVWRWGSETGQRCETLTEVQLHKIWEKVR